MEFFFILKRKIWGGRGAQLKYLSGAISNINDLNNINFNHDRIIHQF